MGIFDEIAALRERGDSAAALGRLLAELENRDDPAALFQAYLLQARLGLGLPALTSGKADEIPADQQPAYEELIRKAARRVGSRLLDQGKIGDAWTYYRLIGEPKPVADALERFTPKAEDAGQLGDLLQIALHDGVHPQRGFDLVLEQYGVCNAITTVAQTLYQQGPARLHAIRRLVATLHREIGERLRADIQQRTGALPPADHSLSQLVQSRTDLFEEDNYHVDLSHLSSVIQFALELPPGAETGLAEELCIYGERLNTRFQPPGDAPFGVGYAAYRRYFETLNRKNVAENLAFFRAQAAAPPGEDHTTGPAEVLVHLLTQLQLPGDALTAYEQFLGQADPRRLACPSPIVLSQQLGDYQRLAALCRMRDDLVGYAAALLQGKRV